MDPWTSLSPTQDVCPELDNCLGQIENSSVPTRCVPTCQGRAPVQHPKPVPSALNLELSRRDQVTVTLCLPDRPSTWAGGAEPPCLGLGVPAPHESAVPVLKVCLLSGLQLPEPRASLLEVVRVPGKLEAGVGKAGP